MRVRDIVNGPAGTLDVFKAPIADVAHDYLNFGITRTQASNITAVLLAQFALKFPSLLDKTGGSDTVKKQIDHLISLTSKISRERHKYDLGSYSQLTYLGLLWGETALIMAKQLAKRSEGEKLRRWFERRALHIEEHVAHELEPSLMHPISLMPFGNTEYMRAGSVGVITARGLYKGAGDLAKGPFDPDKVWARVRAYSTSSDRWEPHSGLYEECLSPEMSEHLGTFLLTMKLGQSMR